MKIKIIKSVTLGAKIHRKGTVADLDNKSANLLINGEFAEEVKAEPPPNPGSNRNDRLEEFKNLSKPELEAVKADAEKVLAENPGRADAKAVIDTISALLAKK